MDGNGLDGDGLDLVWKHSWPSTKVLCEYLTRNKHLLEGKVVLELGAGAACLQSLIALKFGAKKVYLSDRQEVYFMHFIHVICPICFN
jgi:predicted nicotinamide N-methyase